jgi:hypothetical protein
LYTIAVIVETLQKDYVSSLSLLLFVMGGLLFVMARYQMHLSCGIYTEVSQGDRRL